MFMGPSGSTSHTATAMDPVHGSQWSISPTDITLTAKQGANEQLRVQRYGGGVHGHGFNGLHGSTKPAYGRRTATFYSGCHTALTGQSSHLAAVHGDTPMEVEMGAAPLAHRPDQLGISLPGISRLSGSQPSLSGVRPPPGFTGTPMGSGEFSGSGQTPAVRQAPPLHFSGIRPLPNRTTATITSCNAPAVTMASYGGVSTSTSLGRPISSLGIAQNNQVSAPLGQNQQQWSGAIPQGYSCPTPRGLAKSPWTRPLTGSFQGASPQLWSNILLQLWNRTSVRSVGSLDRVPWIMSSHCNSCSQI